MAQGLTFHQGPIYRYGGNVTRSPMAPRFIPPEPESEEYEMYMRGREPDVQLFSGASETKEAPNYSDWLYAKSQPKERTR